MTSRIRTPVKPASQQKPRPSGGPAGSRPPRTHCIWPQLCWPLTPRGPPADSSSVRLLMGVGTHYTYTAPLVRGTGNENCYQTYNGDQPRKQPRHPLPAPSWLSRRAAPASARARACRVLTAARAGGCGRTGAQTRNAVAPAGQAPHLPAPPGNAAHRPCCHGSLPKWRCFKSEKKKSPFLHTQKSCCCHVQVETRLQ